MEIRKVSLSDMFSMLLASFRLVGRHPGRFALASLLSLIVLIVLVALVIGVLAGTAGLDQIAQFAKPGQEPDLKTLFYVYASVMLFGVLLMPPFVAGWFMLCRNLAVEGKASALAIFSVYGSAASWKKLILYSVLSMLLYIALYFLFIFLCIALGVDSQDFKTVLMPQAGSDPMAILNLGAGFWAAYLGLMCFSLLMQSMFMLGFTQAALTESGIGDSLKAGIGGVLKNLLPIIAFTIIVFIAMLIVIALAILVGILAVAALSFIHESVAIALGAVLYLALILFIYPLTFSFQYYFWHGILGNGTNETRVSASEVSA